MSHTSFLRLLSVLALTLVSSVLSAQTITYAVGTCRPSLPSFQTISAALTATPPANVVEVCPGTYNEQVHITQPVTLEGIANGDSAQAIIASPSVGLVTNASDDLGRPVAAQLWVDNVSGPVNITDLTVDGTGNGVPAGTEVVGIFDQNSGGTVNRVSMRNQKGNGSGVGILAEGGSSNPSVTIENASIHDFDSTGILVDTNSATPELFTAIKGNEVTTTVANSLAGIFSVIGAAVTITNNFIANLQNGILIGGGTGSISGNTVVQSFGTGIAVFERSVTGSISGNTVINAGSSGIGDEADGVSVTSNKILNTPTGIVLGTSVAAIQGNTITNSPTGIDFLCHANPNVRSNIIMDTGTALNSVPSTIGPHDTYFNVGAIRAGGC